MTEDDGDRLSFAARRWSSEAHARGRQHSADLWPRRRPRRSFATESHFGSRPLSFHGFGELLPEGTAAAGASACAACFAFPSLPPPHLHPFVRCRSRRAPSVLRFTVAPPTRLPVSRRHARSHFLLLSRRRRRRRRRSELLFAVIPSHIIAPTRPLSPSPRFSRCVVCLAAAAAAAQAFGSVAKKVRQLATSILSLSLCRWQCKKVLCGAGNMRDARP